jgi:hypothetical protein
VAGGGDISAIDGPVAIVLAGGASMPILINGIYAPSTLGVLLREFSFGHARQLESVLRQHLVALAERGRVLAGIEEQAFIDIDSLLRPVYGHAKQGASYGHTKIAGKQVLRKGLSPLATTISTLTNAPVVAGIRLRAGKTGSGKGAGRMVAHARSSRRGPPSSREGGGPRTMRMPVTNAPADEASTGFALGHHQELVFRRLPRGAVQLDLRRRLHDRREVSGRVSGARPVLPSRPGCVPSGQAPLGDGDLVAEDVGREASVDGHQDGSEI